MSGSLPLAIDCRNLTYRYGKFTAVDDLTLQASEPSISEATSVMCRNSFRSSRR
jgi:hypothetical protein